MPELPRPDSTAVDPGLLLRFTYYRGRVALSALLSALGVGEGDHVILQAYTCLAVPEGILSVGAWPIFVDIEDGGVNMDPDALEAAITSTVKAIVVQHTFGIPAQMDRISSIAEKHGLPIVEDCCHSLGSRFRGRVLGQFGAGAFYSFEWGKQVVVGLGGSAVPSDQKVAKVLAVDYARFVEPPRSRVAKINLQYFAYQYLLSGRTYSFFKRLYRALSQTPMLEGNFSPNPTELTAGFGWRMDASLKGRLERKVRTLPVIIEQSRRVAEEYRAGLSFSTPRVPEGSDVVYQRYPFFTDDKPAVLQFAISHNIEMADWYRTPVHPLMGDALSSIGYRSGACPRAERAAMTLVSLPVSSKIAPAAARENVRTLTSFK